MQYNSTIIIKKGEKVMPVPDALEIRKPLLEIFRDEAPHSFSINEILEIVAESLGERLEEMSSNEKTTLKNNINDAKNYLRNHKLLSHPSKNTYMITRAGSKVLENNPDFIDDDYFIQPPTEPAPEIPVDFSEQEFLDAPEEVVEESSEPVVEEFAAAEEQEPAEEPAEDFDSDDPIDETGETGEPEEIETTPEPEPLPEIEPEVPEEPEPIEEPSTPPPTPTPEPVEPAQTYEVPSDVGGVEEVLEKFNEQLAEKVLEKVAAVNQDMFCALVMDLLSKMGYRAFQNARYTNEAEGSDLIHGVILENKAGMTPIYIQARRLSPSRTVGKADMMDFIEALSDKGGKGMFATTGTFSEQAEVCARDERIMLLDGKKLASLMIANNFCVNVEKIFELKTIDTESFAEYER
ncbi:MAG: restriction endonuclease [Synergistaceae bacterium]|nr:restriction endonuclease [Synergistaceae bacterium]